MSRQVKNFAVIYLVDITEVPDFNKMYELYDPCTVMFFFRWGTPVFAFQNLNVNITLIMIVVILFQ